VLICVGAIEEIDSSFNATLDHTNGSSLIDWSAEGHRAETDAGYPQIGPVQLIVVHISAFP
jgi:hypothetical protein